MEIVDTFAEARSLNRGTVGFAPTLGFVHEGHLSLIERARMETDHVLVSLFVNPLQFGEGEDFVAYPRQLHRDARLIESAGADVLFAPAVAEMYPVEPATTVEVAPLAAHLDGVARPFHFAGVATVVAKYFAGLRPERAYFGRKDAQQLAIITRMAADLSMPVAVIGCPTIREHDGLALSSRNVYLQERERDRALSLSRGLMAAADRVDAGERSGPALERFVRETVPAFEFEYVAVMDRATVTPLAVLNRPAFLAVAGRVGKARLIDNIHFDFENGEVSVDRGVRLTGPSILYEQ
jgi:pantoate--beta-alanine ligase